MNTHPYPQRHTPPLNIDPEQVKRHLRDLAATELCHRCERAATDAISDIAKLLIQVYSLRDALVAERLRAANLEAAIRAAIGAHTDGEAEPIAYLRDELPDIAGGDRLWRGTATGAHRAATAVPCGVENNPIRS